MIQTIIYVCYCLIALFVAVILVREIIRSKSAQEVVLFSVILIPFVLRVLQLK